MKLKTLIQRNHERIAALRNFLELSRRVPDADNLDSVPDILPKLTNSVFVDVLRQHGVLFVSCEREADVHVAELACFLRCPFVTNDSDFYIFRPSASAYSSPSSSILPYYQFIPLVSLGQPCRKVGPSCDHCSPSASCYLLPCRIFNPQTSPIGRIYPPLLPLLAAVIGNDFLSSVRVPPVVSQMTQDPSRSARFVSYNGRRIDALVQWLSSFGDDIYSPIQAILTQYSEADRETIAHQLRAVALDYTLRPTTTGRKLAERLHLPTELYHKGLPMFSTGPDTCCFPSNVAAKSAELPCKPSREKSDHVDEKCEIFQLVNLIGQALPKLRVNSTDFDSASSYTDDSLSRGWSCSLTRKLHFLDLPTGVMDTLYVQTGSVQRVLFEDLFGQNASIYQVLDPLRKLFYNLLVGLEATCGGSNKLCGMRNGHVIEHRRQTDRMVPFPIPLSPIQVPQSQNNYSIRKQSVDFLWTQLNVTRQNRVDPLPVELQLISVVLILWFRQSSLAHYEQVSCECSSVPLAFVMCALTSYSFLSEQLRARSPSLGYSIAQLCESFANLATRFKSSSVNNGQFIIQIVHQLNELQLLTLEIKMLISLIEGLMAGNQEIAQSNLKSSSSVCLTDHPDLFGWPNWILFPSGRLIYWVAACLQGMHPKSRYNHALNVCLPMVHMACPSVKDPGRLQALKKQMHQIFLSTTECIQD